MRWRAVDKTRTPVTRTFTREFGTGPAVHRAERPQNCWDLCSYDLYGGCVMDGVGGREVHGDGAAVEGMGVGKRVGWGLEAAGYGQGVFACLGWRYAAVRGASMGHHTLVTGTSRHALMVACSRVHA